MEYIRSFIGIMEGCYSIISVYRRPSNNDIMLVSRVLPLTIPHNDGKYQLMRDMETGDYGYIDTDNDVVFWYNEESNQFEPEEEEEYDEEDTD